MLLNALLMIILSFRKTVHQCILRSTQFNCCSAKLSTSFLRSYGPETDQSLTPLTIYIITRNVGQCATCWPPCRIQVAPSVQRRKVWLTPTTSVPCSNAAKTRNPMKYARVPQTRQQILAVSRPKFTVLSGHVEKVLLFNKFFPIVDTCLSCEDTARQSCAIMPKWRFFASCISSEPCAAHFRPAFALGPNHVWKYGRHPICGG